MLTRQGPGAAKGAKPSKTHVAPTWPEEHSSRNSDGASSRARGGLGSLLKTASLIPFNAHVVKLF